MLLIANYRIHYLLFIKKSLGKQQERLMSKQIEILKKKRKKEENYH